MAVSPRVALLLGAYLGGCSLQDFSSLNRCTDKPESSACPLGAAGGSSATGGAVASAGTASGAPTEDLPGGAAGAGDGNLPMAGDGAGGLAPAPPDLRVQYAYFTADKDPSTDTPAMSKSIRAELEVVNDSAAEVPLSDITLKYYYTSEAAQVSKWSCNIIANNTLVSCDGVALSFASYEPQSGLTNAYFEVSFTGDVAKAWMLGANGGTSGPIQLFVSKAGFELQNLTNDYSWDGTVLTLTDWPKVTL